MSTKTCLRCSRPVHVDANGRIHDYCSKTCAFAKTPAPTKTCPRCSRPVHVDANGRIHDYCSRTCAFAKTVAPAKCKTPGCNNPRAVAKNGQSYDYCSKSCRDGSMPIFFYRHNEPFFEFTNFWVGAVTIRGVVWPSTEHFYQAMKFTDPTIQETIRKCKTPGEARALAGGAFQHSVCPLFHSNKKDDVMVEAVTAKLRQYPHILRLLKSTGSRLLIENSPSDVYWGYANAAGQNQLGQLLMRLRSTL